MESELGLEPQELAWRPEHSATTESKVQKGSPSKRILKPEQCECDSYLCS